MSAIATIDLGKIKFKWRGAYDAATAYSVDDVVSSANSSWVCVLPTTGNLPLAGSAYWELMALGGNPNEIMTTSGDILIRGASSLERVGIGTAGQPLEVANGKPAWGVKGQKLINKVNVTYQGGQWAIPYAYGWATGLHQAYTPQRADTQIAFRAFFSTASSDTGSIHQGRFNVSGVYDGNQYTFNVSGHSYYAGHSQHVEYVVPSWGTTSRTIGIQLGKHSSGYGINLHASSWGNPSDAGGTGSTNSSNRSAFYTIEEWLIT